jgi:hypothetical protein
MFKESAWGNEVENWAIILACVIYYNQAVKVRVSTSSIVYLNHYRLLLFFFY